MFISKRCSFLQWTWHNLQCYLLLDSETVKFLYKSSLIIGKEHHQTCSLYSFLIASINPYACPLHPAANPTKHCNAFQINLDSEKNHPSDDEQSIEPYLLPQINHCNQLFHPFVAPSTANTQYHTRLMETHRLRNGPSTLLLTKWGRLIWLANLSSISSVCPIKHVD